VTKNPAAASFVTNYTKTYGQLGAYSASGYDCMKIVINAIKAAIDGGAKPAQNSGDSSTATTFRQAVIDAMAKTDYTGLTGHHTFDANGDTTNKVITVQQLASVSGAPGWKVLTSLTVH
jgi:branched-chain amino acid transport system substrate-binding protein